MKLNVWHSSLPAGQSFDNDPPVPGAVRGGAIHVDDDGMPYDIPLWEIDVPDVATLIEIIRAAGGEATISTLDGEYPHPELMFP